MAGLFSPCRYAITPICIGPKAATMLHQPLFAKTSIYWLSFLAFVVVYLQPDRARSEIRWNDAEQAALVRITIRNSSDGGSGFVVKSLQGGYYVITAQHVLESVTDISDIDVSFSSGRSGIVVQQIYFNSDVAALELANRREDYDYLAVGDGSRINERDEVSVSGFPRIGSLPMHVTLSGVVTRTQGQDGQVRTNISSGKGLSGAPYIGLLHTVIGIHLNNDDDGNGSAQFLPISKVFGPLRDKTGVVSAAVGIWTKGGPLLPPVYAVKCDCVKDFGTAPVRKYENQCPLRVTVRVLSRNLSMIMDMDSHQTGMLPPPPVEPMQPGFGFVGCPRSQ
jgi:hypothetical protein